MKRSPLNDYLANRSKEEIVLDEVQASSAEMARMAGRWSPRSVGLRARDKAELVLRVGNVCGGLSLKKPKITNPGIKYTLNEPQEIVLRGPCWSEVVNTSPVGLCVPPNSTLLLSNGDIIKALSKSYAESFVSSL